MREGAAASCSTPERLTAYATSKIRSAVIAPAATQGAMLHRQRDLVAVQRGHHVTRATARLVRLEPANLDGRSFRWRGLSIDQALVARCELAAANADRVELVDFFRDREEF